MNHVVVWSPEAEAELAAIWMSTAKRAEVTRAAAAIDRRLAANGPDEGESRAADMRIAFEAPVVVVFRVDQSSRVVTVARVREYGRR